MKYILSLTIFLLVFVPGFALAQTEEPEDACAVQVAASLVLIVPFDAQGQVLATGSGVIVDPRGVIYTNRHVIEEGENFHIYLVDDPAEPPVLRYAAVDYGFSTNPYADFGILQINQSAEMVPNAEDSSQFDLVSQGILPGDLDLPALLPANEAVVGEVEQVRVFAFPSVTGPDAELPSVSQVEGQITSVRQDEFEGQTLPSFLATDAAFSPEMSSGIAVNDACEFIGMSAVVSADPLGNPIEPAASVILPIGTLQILARQGGLAIEPPPPTQVITLGQNLPYYPITSQEGEYLTDFTLTTTLDITGLKSSCAIFPRDQQGPPREAFDASYAIQFFANGDVVFNEFSNGETIEGRGDPARERLGIVTNSVFEVTIIARGNRYEVLVDGESVMVVQDDEIPAGALGLWMPTPGVDDTCVFLDPTYTAP